jgi:hypothetical protein
MARSSYSKVVSTTSQNYTPGGISKSPPKDKTKTASESSSRQSIKGWVYLDDAPDSLDLIIGDPKSPKNIIHGKRTRKGPNVNDSQLGKATHPISVSDDDEEEEGEEEEEEELEVEVPAQRANVKVLPPVVRHKHKDKGSRNTVDEPTPDDYSDHEPPTDSDEDGAATEHEEISAEDIRRDVLALVNHSLQIANDIAAYMQLVEGHEVQGQKLDRDVNKVLTGRVKKRKAETQAQKGKSGKAVKFAL